MTDLRFSQRYCWLLKYCWTWRHVTGKAVEEILVTRHDVAYRNCIILRQIIFLKNVHIQWGYDRSHLRRAEHRHVGFIDSKLSEYSKVEAISSDMMTSRFPGRLVNSNWREWNLWTDIQNCRKHKLHFPCKWKWRSKYDNHMCQCS